MISMLDKMRRTAMHYMHHIFCALTVKEIHSRSARRTSIPVHQIGIIGSRPAPEPCELYARSRRETLESAHEKRR
jgi:hypothetical protein